MPGAANVIFYYHSGLSVEVGKTLLIFDYWRGNDGELPAYAQIDEAYLAAFERTFVFVSHDHDDHLDEIIYSWDHVKLNITYVVADDLPIGKRGKRMKSGDTQTFGDVEVRAFSSTDKGVSFYVTVDGLHIFHAGDLNLWHWREESTAREVMLAERAYLKAVSPIEALPVDIAMFPVDPRMGGMFDAGANHFIMTVKPRIFIPIHWLNRPEISTEFARRARTKYTEVLPLNQAGQRAELAFKERELYIHLRTLDASARSAARSPKKEEPLGAYAEGDPFLDSDLPVNME